MTEEERGKRIAAWGWAAVTLGVEAGADRLRGLVEVTESVPIGRLKQALEAVIKTEPAGFLPSPGAVIEAAKRLAEREHGDQHRSLAAGREMSHADHLRWMAEANPEDWDKATWAAFVERNAIDARFAERVRDNVRQRHEWAEAEVNREIGRRDTSAAFRLRLRRQLNVEAIDRFPRPHPLGDGWLPSKDFDPIAGLSKRMRA